MQDETRRAQRGRTRKKGASWLHEVTSSVAPRLSSAREAALGFRIQRGLARLAALLPRHPAGYRRILERIEDAAQGREQVYPWLARRTEFRRDSQRARMALGRAEEEARRRPASAWKRLEAGFRVLINYPLEPEVASRFARELGMVRGRVAPGQEPTRSLDEAPGSPAAAASPTGAGGRLDSTPRALRLERLIQRSAERVEADKNLLVLANVRLVLKEVLRRRPRGIEPADLYQEGILGLHRAAFRFDAGRGLRFSTYATYWIRQAIRKSLSEKSRMIRVPQTVQEEVLKVGEGGPQEARRLRTVLASPVPLEGRLKAGQPHDPQFHIASVPQAVERALERLSPREKFVLEHRFGLGDAHRERLEDIGARLRLSRERIRQIEIRALKRLSRLRGLAEVYEDLADVEPESGLARPVR